MASTTARRRTPIQRESLAARAGALVALSARRQKQVAHAAGVSEQAVSQWRHGAVYGPFYSALEAAADLGEALATDHTDPFPAIVEMEAVVMEVALRHRTTEQLVREWRDMYEREFAVQAEEDAASARYVLRRDLRDLARAHKAEAAFQVRFAAICELLEERGVDPLDAEWDRVESGSAGQRGRDT